jgi:hypothetical protein
MSLCLKINDNTLSINECTENEVKLNNDAVTWNYKKVIYVAFEILNNKYLITSKCNFDNKGIRKESFIQILDNSLWNKDNLTKVQSKKCGNQIQRIAGDEETKDCKHFKRTIKIENTDYLIDLSC